MLPRSIWLINIVGLLCNISSSIIFGLFASFLRLDIGLSVVSIGFLQGMLDSFSYGVKLSAGFLSDFFKKRRLLIIIGIIFIMISKPILALASTLPMIFFARGVDRLGSGIQATPRDALTGDLCPKEMRGKCYGLRGVLTVLGSVIGAFLGMQMMIWTDNNFRLIFWLASVPALLALIFSLFFMPDSFALREAGSKKFEWANLKKLDKKFWKLIFISGLFLMFRYNEAVLALKAMEDLKLSHTYVSMIFIIFNLAICVMAYPVGLIADKTSKEKVLFVGFIIGAMAHLCCGWAATWFMFFVTVVLWGVQFSISTPMLFSLIADYSYFDIRGTAFSIFNLVGLIGTFIGGFVFQYLGRLYGFHAPFFMGSFFCCMTAILFYIFFKEKIKFHPSVLSLKTQKPKVEVRK